MLDTRALLAGLEDYRRSVERHLEALRQDFQEVTATWLALSEGYAGNAADEFRPIWEATSHRFRDYTERSLAIVRVLGERIEHLREADRAVGLGG